MRFRYDEDCARVAGGGVAMRAESQKRLNDLRWLREADDYLESARIDLRDSPGDARLKAFIRLTEEVVAYERRRLGAEADASHEPPALSRRAQAKALTLM